MLCDTDMNVTSEIKNLVIICNVFLTLKMIWFKFQHYILILASIVNITLLSLGLLFNRFKDSCYTCLENPTRDRLYTRNTRPYFIRYYIFGIHISFGMEVILNMIKWMQWGNYLYIYWTNTVKEQCFTVPFLKYKNVSIIDHSFLPVYQFYHFYQPPTLNKLALSWLKQDRK